MDTPCVNEGFISVTGGRVWYQKVGNDNKTPLLVLHGGPGIPHNYMEPLSTLADERQVIYYDQLGCGKSDRPENEELWTVERFIEELHQVRQALGLDRFHLLGHSWGTMLATVYYLAYPEGITSLILASPFLNMPLFTSQILPKLIGAMTVESQTHLKNHIPGSQDMRPEYLSVLREYNRRYLFHKISPDSVRHYLAGTNDQVREILFGVDDLFPTGRIGTYDRTEALPGIKVPVLLTCGRYDECTPEFLEWHQQQIPGSKMRIFEQSAHNPHLEEPDEFVEAVRGFLGQVECE
jgi:proline iminopeptidase